jgi:hypothetical protein
MTTLYVDNIAPNLQSSVAIPGHVIQVVEGTITSNSATSSTSFVASNLSASITPSSTASQVLIVVNGHMYAPSNNQFSCDIYRNTTSITGKSGGFMNAWYESTRGRFPVHCSLLDSPSTTSAVTYTLYIRSISGGEISFPNQLPNVKNTITLMEIAG